MTGSKFHAIVMGDLVQSERFARMDLLHAAFNDAVQSQNRVHASALASPLTITLGDEFQGLATTLAQAVPIIRNLRFHLMADTIDCRFVVGQAEVRTEINPDRAWNMMGPGLARAREVLNEKSARTMYRFSLPGHPVLETLLDALGAGLTLIERGWTDQQRADIACLIAGQSPMDLARRRNVSVHSIYKVRSSGNFEAYMTQWGAISAALSAIDTGTAA